MTKHEFDLVENYRNLGGNLIFLSANNFFWEVRREGRTLRRTRLWREMGRPESGVLGVQYRANDDGRRQQPFVVRSAATAPWLWAGTGLTDGSTFGQELGGYGIEIDQTSPFTPRRHDRARRDPGRVRAGSDRADDLLRDRHGREGVRRGRDRLRRQLDDLADAADAREPVGAPVDAVELVRATTPAELAALRRLYALYLHDLSEFTSHYELDEEARWQPDYLEDMLTWPECHCLLILAGGKPAGFALVSVQPFPHMPRDADARLAEFFVAQPYRRRGIGRAAALAALARFPGDGCSRS